MVIHDIIELREEILSRIDNILRSKYNERLEDYTPSSVAACLSYKSDPHLNELRLALERIERDEYGHCIFCKNMIAHHVLKELPTAHFCEQCAVILRYRTMEPPA